MKERFRAGSDNASSLLARVILHDNRLGDDRRAEEDFSRFIELEQDYAEALENRASAQRDLEEYRLGWED